MGLGWAALTDKDEKAGGVSLARARDLARDARSVLAQDRDPIDERQEKREAAKRETAAATACTFEAAARALVENKRAG
jgi:hypothetical protein